MVQVEAEALPPRARKILYLVFAVLSMASGAFQVGYAAAELSPPVWVTVAVAVLSFLGTSMGWTAYSNTPTTVRSAVQSDPVVEEASGVDVLVDYTDPDYARS